MASLPFLLAVACATSRAPADRAPVATSGAPSADSSSASLSCAAPPAAPVEAERTTARNVDGAPLAVCGTQPITGAYRDGRCATGPDDLGVHVVCARVTDEFLAFTRDRGNDLVTPRGGFPGLRAGDRWCLCASRWAEAEAAGVAPPVDLAATEAAALRHVSRAALDRHALR